MINSEVSIVVPVFNEEKNISLLIERAIVVMSKFNYSWELIFVDDGSTDKSINILEQYSNSNTQIKYISLTRNFGHQAALTAGLDVAVGNAVITMDCDLQDPPEVIDQMLIKWQEGYKIVYARRKSRKDRLFKRITAKCYYKLLYKFSDNKIHGNIGDFRLLDRRVLNELVNMREKSRYLRGMVYWLGFKYAIIDYQRPLRIHGKTGFSLLKMIRLAMDGILNFSLLPLRLGFILGIITILTGFFFLTYIAVDTIFFGKEYQLYKWLSVVTFIFIGFLFILIWILAEYIGKIYNESKGRPIYVINEKKNI